jgi:isopropylmalate/homocitrate/citramalate synthase
VVLSAHCHNDFGLALANTYAALEAGAQAFDVSVNGLGERAGGAAVDEFLIGLWALYGIDIGINLAELTKISEWVAEASGIPIPVTKPVVGENAFLQKLDVHVAAARKAPFLFEPFEPEVVGRKRTLRYGVGSGLATLEEMLKELKLNVSPDELPELKRRLDREVQNAKHSISSDQLKAFALQHG